MSTTFEDGPANGQVLMIRRNPLLLRVVRSKTGKWDALDQRSDMADPGEDIFVYRLVASRGHVHLRMARGSGFYAMGTYRLHERQPEDATARSVWEWPKWALKEAATLESKDAQTTPGGADLPTVADAQEAKDASEP